MHQDQFESSQSVQPYNGGWRQTQTPVSNRRSSSRILSVGDRLRSATTYLLAGLWCALLLMGGYGIYRVSLSQHEHDRACAIAKSTVLNEIDESLFHDHFPSLDQQDEWRYLMRQCENESVVGRNP